MGIIYSNNRHNTCFFENIYSIPNLITTGKLDAYLTQPLNVLYNVSISKTNPSAFGDLIYGTVLAFICVGADFYKAMLFILFACLGGVTLTAFFVIIGSLTFWLKGGDHVIYTLSCVVFMTGTYPEGVFKGLMKVIVYAIVPIGFVLYMPIRIILNFNFIYLPIVFSATLFFVFLSFFIFNKGLKIYCSGNSMSIRF